MTALNQLTKNTKLKKMLVLLVVLVLIFIVYKLFVFGNINIQNSSKNTVISVNDVPYLKDTASIKLRPGNYTINASSPEFNTTKQVKVSAFGTKQLNAIENKWNYEEAVRAATDSQEANIRLLNASLINKLWYSGLYVVDTQPPEMFVIKFEDGQWALICRGYDYKECENKNLPNEVFQHAKSSILIVSGD